MQKIDSYKYEWMDDLTMEFFGASYS